MVNDNEIIKALECCNRNGSCSKCPYDRATFEHELDCASAMTADALDLINRQRADIENLKDINEHLNVFVLEAREAAIKEFAERLKKRGYTNNYCQDVVLLESIDNLVKEMTEGTE